MHNSIVIAKDTTEQELNEWLLASRNLAETYYKKKKFDIAKRILNVASDMARFIIALNDFNAPQYCGTCHRKFTNAIEKDFIRAMGFCLSCDKISTEVQYGK